MLVVTEESSNVSKHDIKYILVLYKMDPNNSVNPVTVLSVWSVSAHISLG